MKKHEGGEVLSEVFVEDGLNIFLGQAFASRRYVAALVFAGFVIAILSGRAAWMLLARGPQYRLQSEENRLERVPVLPKRGIIRDRNGEILADNISYFRAMLTPFNLSLDPEEREEALSLAGRLLGRPMSELLPFANATGAERGETVSVAEDLPYDEAMAFAVALPKLPGFELEVGAKRRYPKSREVQSLSHVLGYLGKLSKDEYKKAQALGYRRNDSLGKTGAEKSYESHLRGELGERVREVDAYGRAVAFVGDTPPVDGRDLDLTLDFGLQKTAEEALRAQLAKGGIRRGSVIALDPRDGSVLALVSWPAYDDNFFSGSVSSTYYNKLIRDSDQPLYPRAFSGAYPSGSTVKIVIAAAALIEGVITEKTTVVSLGGIRIGEWFFPDWKAGGHGLTSVRRAVAWSVNTFFYTVGGGYESFTGLGAERLSQWMKKFGLGERTGLDLPGEGQGLVPDPDWKQKTKGERWFVGDTYNLSIGQGDLLVTPLQVAAYTAALANGGTLIAPHVAQLPESEIKRKEISPGHEKEIKIVREGMRDNVVYGSGRALADMPFAVSGKTGTAQWHGEKPTHAWFTSYAPSDDPEIVVTILLEEGGEGSSVSVPVARQVLEAWWRLRNEK